MSLLRRWGLPAWIVCLPILALACGAARAADDKPPPLDAKAVDATVFKTLRDVINEGADMYNGQGKYANMERDFAGCYHLYQGALIATRPLLGSHADLQEAIDKGLDDARNTPDMTKRAFVLRAVIDKIRDAVNPNPKPPPSVAEIKTEGKVTKADGGKITVNGKDFTITDDKVVMIDGKPAKATDIKVDSTATVTTDKDGKITAVVVKTVPPPVPPPETTVMGKVVSAGNGKLTAIVGEKEKGYSISETATVMIDGKAGKTEDIKKDSAVTLTLKDGVVTKVEAKSPTVPPPAKVATVLGKVVGVDKDKLTVSVDEKEKSFTVPAAAKVTIDDKDGKLADLKKDSAVIVNTKDDVVVSVDAKSPTPPPPPKETKVTGKVTKVDANKLTVKPETGDEKTFAVPEDAKVTIDGKAGKAGDIKVDYSATVTEIDGKVTKIEVKGPGAPPPPQSLWDRLGGEANVAKVVDDFVNSAGKDPKVNFWRDPTFVPSKEQVTALKKSVVEFVSSATGGPLKYTGKDMKTVHKGMKITDDEFNALAADLKAALEKNGAKAEDVKAVMDAVEGTRKDIVEVKAPEDKQADTGSVSGKVTYKGQPLPAGTVIFVSADGKASSAALAPDGTYKVEKLKPGEYSVGIETDSVKPKPPGDKPKPPDDKKADDKPADKQAPKYVAIPAKYADPAKSGLKVTIVKGDQQHDFDLQD
jgi:hemoglobin